MSTVKESNPKDILGGGKVPFDRLPFPVLAEVAVALHEGARKYGAANWREDGVQSGVYISAAMRHLAAWQEGEDIDPQSGLSHISKAIAGLMVFRDGMVNDNWIDTRPLGCLGFIATLNDRVAQVNEMYPNCVPPNLHEGRPSKEYTP